MDASTALGVLLGAEVESMDRVGLDGVLAARRVVCAVTDAIEVRVARQARRLADEGRSEPASDVLRESGRRSGREAAAAARREQTCGRLPSFEPALADGSLSTGHLDALAAATAQLNDDQQAELAEHEQALLADAQRSPVEVFERHCRDLARRLSVDDGADELAAMRRRNRIRRWVDRVTGMHHIHAELDPESACKVWLAITAQLRTMRHEQHRDATSTPSAPADDTADTGDASGGDDGSDGDAGPGCPAAAPTTASQPAAPEAPMSFEQMEAQAFIDLITGARALDRRTPEVIVLLDFDTLIAGLHHAGVCETSEGIALPPSTVRRLCCDAEIVPVVLNGDGEVLDVGRTRRLATPAQRRALWAMYATCGYPGCRVPVDCCEIHHPREWWDAHGPTDLDNLIPLCVRHHHLVHEGGWTLTLHPHRVVTITRPDGTLHHQGATTNRAPPDRSTAA